MLSITPASNLNDQLQFSYSLGTRSATQ